MPALNPANRPKEPRSVMVYGPSKSGKTELVSKLTEAGFKLLVIDLENSSDTYYKLSPEALSRVDYLRVRDVKDNPIGITTCLQLISGAKTNICAEHGKVGCGPCTIAAKTNPEAMLTYELAKLDPSEWVVLFDSFTQITSSAHGHVTSKLKLGVDTEEFKHWKHQGVLLEKFLDLCQNPVCNIVVISHEIGIDQPDKTEKIVPAGGTKNFARNVGRYFGDIVYLAVKNGKHKAFSTAASAGNVLVGGRTGIDISENPAEKFAELFRRTDFTQPTKSETAASSVSKAVSLKERLASKK